MAMMLGGRGSISSEINVTSLIDVLLVLLIIFMVLQRPSYGERAVIPQPPDKTQALPPPKDIVIQLQEAAAGRRPTLKINQDTVSWQELEARLMKIYSERADKVAFVKGDPEIDFQYVVEVIDVTHHAGVTHVGLLGN